MRSLKMPAEERAELFKQFTQEDPNRLAILNTLATAHDEREELKGKRDTQKGHPLQRPRSYRSENIIGRT